MKRRKITYYFYIAIMMVNVSFVSQPKTSEPAGDSRFKMWIEFTAAHNFHREILLTVDERATDGFDKGFEALIGEVFPNDMYWVLAEDKVIIQAIGAYSIESVFPIGIKSKGDGPIEIKVDTIENPYADMEVFLRDNRTMDTYDILNNTFSISLEEGEFKEAYSIVFKPKVDVEEAPIQEDVEEPVEVEDEGEVLGIEYEPTISELVVFIDDYSELLRIKKPEEMIINKISFFNMVGQQLGAWTTSLDESQIHLPINFNSGVYVILIETNDGRILKKVIIK